MHFKYRGITRDYTRIAELFGILSLNPARFLKLFAKLCVYVHDWIVYFLAHERRASLYII